MATYKKGCRFFISMINRNYNKYIIHTTNIYNCLHQSSLLNDLDYSHVHDNKYSYPLHILGILLRNLEKKENMIHNEKDNNLPF